MPNKPDRLPARDSWLKLSPGAEVQLDARLVQEWNAKTQKLREIRGSVLAKCFEIEYLLDQLICESLFSNEAEPTSATPRELFDELFLKRPVANFASKIEALRKIRNAMSKLHALIPEGVFEKLKEIRELRNDFAHYPITFEPHGDAPSQTLVPLLVTRGKARVIDDTSLREHGKIFTEAFKTLENALRTLTAKNQSGARPTA